MGASACKGTGDGVEIRHADARDFDRVLSLFDAVAGERRWIATEPGFDKEKYRATWQSIVDGNGGAHFIACDAGVVVGSVSLYPTLTGDLDLGMLVSREHRGKGIGTALLQAAVEWAREQNVPKLTLGVFPHNTTAITLYEKAGFVGVGRLERTNVRQTGDVWDVILMEKDMRRSEVARSAEPVMLEPYNAAWQQVYSEEAKTLRHVLTPLGLRGIEHVGSTAIPGMTAKPIVDIMAGVGGMDRLPPPSDALWVSLGYEWGHSLSRRTDWFYFVKRDIAGDRVTQLHVVPFEGRFWRCILAFRDALREDGELAGEYEALKTRLASEFGSDRLRYRDGKADFVASVVKRRLSGD